MIKKNQKPSQIKTFDINGGESAGSEMLFSAGDLDCVFCNGTVRNISINGVEIVRRIYVAVRNEIWNTIGYTVSNLSIHKARSSFHIEYDARHKNGPIDFTWHAVIDGSNDSEIRFTFHGKALSAFKTNRVSFCILHPLATCQGAPCTVLTVNGSRLKSKFPQTISPHQPFLNMRALSQSVKGIKYELFFLGDIFETEDQRNWTDASFKTYCPPLAVPRPYIIKKGTQFSQIVSVKAEKTVKIPKATKKPSSFIPFDCNKKSQDRNIAELGCCLPTVPRGKPALLARALNFSHFRIDVDAATGTLPAFNAIPLEVALFVSGKSLQKQVLRFCESAKNKRAVVKRIVVFHKNEVVTSESTLRQCVRILGTTFPDANIASGTNNYFVEINRKPLRSKLIKNICFSMNPQVHTFDDQCVMDNVFGQAPTLQTAKELYPHSRFFVTPITLRPRAIPENPKKFHGMDPRQKTVFAAAWTCASIINLSIANAAGLTYFDLLGDCGLMEKSGDRVFPAYHVFAYFGDFSGGKIRRIVSDQNSVIGCMLQKNNAKRFLFANLTAKPQKIHLTHVQKNVLLQYLDETTVEFACTTPLEFLNDSGKKYRTSSGELDITLLPYGIAKIDG